jgi:HD-GYP domain-containing protein (c-di-GMP phosphodiesterase class II)
MNLTWRFWTIWTALLAAPIVAFLVLMQKPAWDHTWGTYPGHFWIVSITALGAAIACGLFIGAARSLRETRTIFLGLAFMSIAGIFSVHGLLTPGHIFHEVYAPLQVSTWFSVLAGSFFVACSAVALPEHADDWLKRNGSIVFGAIAVGLGFYIGLSLASPEWLNWVPIRDRTLQLCVAAATFSLLTFSVVRYFQAFLFARLPSQWAMVVALVMLIEVQVSITWGRFWLYSWWEYHFLYAGAFIVLFSGWAIEVVRAGALSVFAEGLTMRDAVAQLNRGHGQPIADLVDAIEHKDLYTLGHVRRVAGYALAIGREMHLSTSEQRHLALAAEMHDVGKIGTPDRILMKPGRLTQEEFEVIKEHVDRGYQIAQNVDALKPVAEAIRHHHEKVDGSGYPGALKQDEIPLLSRIVAVADAYDAMTSGRVYQPAVAQHDALAELQRCAGTHFDRACVEAFLTGLARHEPEDLPALAAPPTPKGAAA